MSLPLRHDHFTEWRQSGSDLPFTVWLKSREALRDARRPSQPAPGGWAVAVAVLIALACALGTFVVLGVALVKGWQ